MTFDLEQHMQALVSARSRFVDWVIVGGESGANARVFDLDWARSIVRQCKRHGVPVFVKQLAREAAATKKDGGAT